MIGAQLVHAAGESARLAALPKGTHAVVLAVPGLDPLLELEAILRHEGVLHAAIREPDTPWSGALMAIGLAPIRRNQLPREARRALRRLPLLMKGNDQ